MKYAIVGRKSKDLLTYKGRVITHEDRREMEYLFPMERIVPLPSYYGEDLTMRLQDHPDMDTVQFPLEKHMNQFRDYRR